MRPLRLASLLVLGLAALAAVGCDAFPEHVVLLPTGEQVEIAMDTPNDDQYVLVGKIEAVAAGADVNEAEQSARNMLRNKAAAMGATLVTIDSDHGSVVMLQKKNKVEIVGRAFKARD
jgi:hypothetical protein